MLESFFFSFPLYTFHCAYLFELLFGVFSIQSVEGFYVRLSFFFTESGFFYIIFILRTCVSVCERTTCFHSKKSVYVQHINMSNVICEARYV